MYAYDMCVTWPACMRAACVRACIRAGACHRALRVPGAWIRPPLRGGAVSHVPRQPGGRVHVSDVLRAVRN